MVEEEEENEDEDDMVMLCERREEGRANENIRRKYSTAMNDEDNI